MQHRYCQQCGAPLAEASTEGEKLQSDKTGHPEDFSTAGVKVSALDSIVASPIPETEAEHMPSVDTDNYPDYLPESTRLAVILNMPSWLQSQQPPLKYLDQSQRYQILSPLPEPTSEISPVEAVELILLDRQAIDPLDNLDGDAAAELQPLDYEFLSSNDAMAENVNDALGNSLVSEISSVEAPTNTEIQAVTDQALPETVLPPVDAGNRCGSVTEQDSPKADPSCETLWSSDDIIQIYLALQDQLYPSFPRILDQLDDVIILENRELLPPLNEAIAQPNVVVPQILHWFHEMTELWEMLAQHRCCASLITCNNIRIDEDQILCLRRLYVDASDRPYSLRDLGILWHDLHQQSLIVWPETLTQLYKDIEDGVIPDVDVLRQRLESAADKIYQDTIASQSTIEVDELEILPTDGPEELNQFAAKIRNIDPMASTSGTIDTSQPSSAPSSVDGVDVADESNRQLPPVQPSIPTDKSATLSAFSDDPTIVLPMQLHTLSQAGSTNNGIQRDHNEDFFAIETQVVTAETPTDSVCSAKGLYILCDGMGGHSAGEVASALAGETLQTYFKKHWTDKIPDEATILNGIVLANRVIYDHNQVTNSEGFYRMGTTLIMLLVQDTRVAIAHVGDSRIYRFTRRQGLEQLTIDHEVGQREIARGVDPSVAYARPDAHQLTQALGPRDEDFIRPDISFLEMNEDSLFILGSDGLTDNNLLENYCQSHIEPLISGNANLDEGVYNLIDLANQVNGHDNITIVIVRVKLRPKLSLLGR